MQIQIIDTPRGRRFLWVGQDYMGKPLEYTAERLTAPPQCGGEKMEIRRKGALWIPEGEILWVGTHGDCACFCNLAQLGRYRQSIDAIEFEDGDEITIVPRPNKKPAPNFGRVLWSSMMVLDYSPQTKLYYDNKVA